MPLNVAWQKFASSELLARYEQTPGFLENFGREPNSGFTQNPLLALVNAAKSASERKQLEQEMKEDVLTALFNAQLIATGYRNHPSRSQSPVLIEADYFEFSDPDWQANAFEVHDIRYGRIRISRGDIRKPVVNDIRGSRAAIDQAIDKLMLSNPDFCKLPRKLACSQIRSYLSAETIPGNGLSDQNLAKAIVRKCGPKRISN